MPKRNSKPEDFSQNALRVVEQAIGEPLAEKPPLTRRAKKALISSVMAEMGRKGGKKGGKRRLETMTPEQRSQVALNAAKTRWSNRGKG
jgi:hypothetical protein